MKRWTYGLGLIAVACVATAVAQPPVGGSGGGRRPMPIIDALDADHDGVISADELRNATDALSTLDKNKDGKLTDDEIRPHGGRPAEGGRDRERIGRNRDVDGRRPDHDTDGQGAPSGRGPGRGDGGPKDQGDRPDGPQGDEGPPVDLERMLNHAMEFDADQDQKLSRDELKKFLDDFTKHHRGPGGPRSGAGPGGRGPRGDAGGSPNGFDRGIGGDERRERPRRPD